MSHSYIWCEQELDSIDWAFQSQSSDEEDRKNHVWQSGRDVHSLKQRKVSKNISVYQKMKMHMCMHANMHHNHIRCAFGLSDLAGGLDSPDAADIEQSPGTQQDEHHPPLRDSSFIDNCGGVQSCSVPEVVNSCAPCTLVYNTWEENIT